MLPIGAVVAALRPTFPDVTHSSLRFLEREGLIRATRTPGGHRLYSPSDIERIRRIKTWQAQRLSLDQIRQRLQQLDLLPLPPTIIRQFLDRVLAGDYVNAYRGVLHLDDVGMPLEAIFSDVLKPALDEIGERWAAGELLVAQEKEISELARELIAELSLRHTHPHPDGPVLVAACVEGEHHDLGLRMVCGLLRHRGFPVHFLGPDVAPRFLLQAVLLHRPAAVLLSAKLPPRWLAVEESLDLLRANVPGDCFPLILVGGQLVTTQTEALRAQDAYPIIDDRPDAALRAVITALAPIGQVHDRPGRRTLER